MRKLPGTQISKGLLASWSIPVEWRCLTHAPSNKVGTHHAGTCYPALPIARTDMDVLSNISGNFIHPAVVCRRESASAMRPGVVYERYRGIELLLGQCMTGYCTAYRTLGIHDPVGEPLLNLGIWHGWGGQFLCRAWSMVDESAGTHRAVITLIVIVRPSHRFGMQEGPPPCRTKPHILVRHMTSFVGQAFA